MKTSLLLLRPLVALLTFAVFAVFTVFTVSGAESADTLTVDTVGPQADLRAVARKTGYHPREGATFNVPSGTQAAKFRIEKMLLSAIAHARKGSYIKISVYSFDREVLADALIRAYRRGVNVQVLTNDHRRTRAMKRTGDVLGRRTGQKSFLHVCTSGCRSRKENLHSKFYLFSQTGRARNVVMLGSVNMTLAAAINQWNDIYVDNDNRKFYEVLSGVYDEMRRDRPVKNAHRVYNIGKRYQLHVFPFPRATQRTDPMMVALRRVSCFGALPGAGRNGRTVVRVAMHAWRTERGVYLARKIRALYAAGCDVKIQYGISSKDVRAVFAQRTKRGYVPVRANGYDTNGDGLIDKYAHVKNLMISGRYGDNRRDNRIYTGSSNWSNTGLSGDEVILRVLGRGLFLDYMREFNKIWRVAGRRVQYQGRTSGRLEPVPLKPDMRVWEND